MSQLHLDRQGADAQVRVRFWAGARAAAGVEETSVPPGSLAEVLDAVAARFPDLAPLLPLCSLLVDGRRLSSEASLGPDALVEVLPPFAGG